MIKFIYFAYMVLYYLYIFIKDLKSNPLIKNKISIFYNDFIFKDFHELVSVSDLINLKIKLQYFTWSKNKYFEVKSHKEINLIQK